MNIATKLFNKYNTPESLLVISSFPKKGGEVADENAVARYTHLLLTHFPKSKKIIVLCEKRKKNEKAYELAENILVIPTYKRGSPKLFPQIQRNLNKLNQVRDIHIQFEFSIYGGKESIPAVLTLLFSNWLKGKYTTIMLHQVVEDINTLSGHLGLAKNSAKTRLFNSLLRNFYKQIGLFTNLVLVHDKELKQKLNRFVNSSKILVIPHGGAEPENLSSALRKQVRSKYHFKNNDFVILAFGYHSWYKGTDWIVREVGELAQSNNNIKLLLAGDQSPTLKDTNAYQKYHQLLTKEIEKYSQFIVKTGFVPENDVKGIFAAADLVVFPYRTRMSASGALSLAWGYQKPFLASRPFATNFKENDVALVMKDQGVPYKEVSFKLTGNSFQNTALNIIKHKSLQKKLSVIGKNIALQRQWSNVAESYNFACTHPALKTYPIALTSPLG